MKKLINRFTLATITCGLFSYPTINGAIAAPKGDVVQAFGVVAAGEFGAGRFVVFGDDAIFQNKFLDEQNRQLAKNLARWLK